MIRLLLLVATAYGAAIPQNPSCLERCVATGGVVGAAADLFYFKSVAVDINNFCNVYTALLKCAAECSQEDLNLLMNHTIHASYVCKDKMEELKTVHDCLEADTTDPLPDCSKVCQVTEHVPLRLDSTANAPVNPTVPVEGTGPICEKQMCVVRCARESLNKQCAGAGDLFRDIARHQVSVGWELLQQQSENANETASQLVALSYLANLPEKCVFLTNLEVFDKAMSDMEGSKDSIPVAGTDFSNDTTAETAAPSGGMGGMASAIDAPAESGEEIHEQPRPAEGPSSAGASEGEAPEKAMSEETGSSMEEATEAPTGGAASGLVPSRPVTEEDKDKEEESEEEKTKEAAPSSGETEGAAATSMEKDKSAASEEKDETMPQTEDAEDEKESSVKEEDKEGEEKEEGAEGMHTMDGEMTTESVIVVDDEDEQIQANAVTPVTETAKVNSSPMAVFSSVVLALLALIAL